MLPICRRSIKYSGLECTKILTNLRMYGSITLIHRNVYLSQTGQTVWSSKNRSYETPQISKSIRMAGYYKLSGSEQKPKSIWRDRIIGTRKCIGFP